MDQNGLELSSIASMTKVDQTYINKLDASLRIQQAHLLLEKFYQAEDSNSSSKEEDSYDEQNDNRKHMKRFDTLKGKSQLIKDA